MGSKEDRYHLLIEHLQDSLAYYEIKEDNGKPYFVFIDMNTSFERMIGCTRDQLIGKRMAELPLVTEKLSFDWFTIFSKVAITGETATFEEYLKGLKRWYRITVYLDSEGYVISLFHDITDKRIKEERTKELSCLYTISRLLRDERYDIDRVLKESITHIPAAFQDPENTCLSITFKDRVYKTRNYKKTSIRLTDSIVAYGLPVGSIEVCYLHTPLQDDPLFLEEERIMLHTITELFGGTVEQRQSEEELQKSKDFLQTTLHSLKDALITTDDRGFILHMNPVAERLTGWTIDEAENKNLKDIFTTVHDQTQEPHESPLVHIHASEKPVNQDKHIELISRDGTNYQIAYTASPIKEVGQKISGMVLVFRDITQKRRIEQDLKESEEHLRILISSIQDIVFTLDIEQRHTNVYGLWIREYGLTPQHVLGKTIQELMGEEKARVHVEANKRALEGEYVVYEWSMKIEDNELYFETSLSPVTDEEGSINGLIGIGRNITKRKKVELYLQEREAFIKLVMDKLPIGIAVHSMDPSIMFDYMNDNFARYYQTTREALLESESFWEAVFEDDDFREEIKTRILTDVSSGDPMRRYWEYIPITREKENKTYYITATATPVPDRDLFISTVWDVTEHKHTKDIMERNIEYLALLLEASESLSSSLNLSDILQILTETTIDLLHMDSSAIYLLEEDTLYLGATYPPLPEDFPEHLRYAPLQEHPHISKAIESLSTVILPDTHQAQQLTEAEQTVIELRNLRTIVYLPLLGRREVLGVLIIGTTDIPCQIREHQLAHCRTLGTLAAIAIENARLYHSLQNELMERIQAQEALQNVQDELEDRVLQRTSELEEARKEAITANHAKSEFLLKISHELRTPLHAILSYSDLGLDKIKEKSIDDLGEYFQRIFFSGNRLRYLIDDLLDLSRIETGSIEYHFEEKDLYKLVNLSRTEMTTLLEGKDIQLEIIEPTFSTLVKVDSNRIMQVLRNLIHNAIKFSPRQSTIQISFKQNFSMTPTLETHIIDEGPGIDSEDLDHIFEIFNQVCRDGSKREGVGLGLAICREIIEAHNGWIYAENQKDRGTRITFVLPALSEEK